MYVKKNKMQFSFLIFGLIAVILSLLNIKIGIALVVSLSFIFLITLDIRYILHALLFSFCFTIPIIKTNFGPSIFIRLDDIFYFIVLISFLLKMLTRKIVLRKNKLFYPIVFYVFAIIMSLASVFQYNDATAIKYAIYHVFKISQYFSIFIFVQTFIEDKDIKNYLKIVWISGLFTSIIGLLQKYSILAAYTYEYAKIGKNITGDQYTSGITGYLSFHYAYLGIYMMIVIFVTLALFESSKNFLVKICYLSSIILFIVIIIYSYSMAAIGVFIISLFLFIMSNKKYRKYIIFLLPITIIYIYILLQNSNLFLYINKIFSRDISSTTLGSRFIIWYKFFQYYPDSLLQLFFGVGFMGFRYFLYPTTGGWGAHNNFLTVLGETGIIGLISFIILLIKIYMYILKNYKKSTIPLLKKYNYCLIFAYTGILITLITQETFSVVSSFASFLGFFMFLLGLSRGDTVLDIEGNE
ncbi:O-antigen ligase family protein [Petroclostridium xylanilyticum]|uniref:O-antigen ligase family protein n=1 Tax=Petroclostridium xylanilyticum TaxID=1792311 RepID=UPI0018E2E290|nr:O-antigen ligase family protein [Petroclostridium xylanilyticum]